MKPISIIIADDHKIVLDGLKSLLEKDFSISGLAADGMELVRLVKAKNPDVVVADASMPKLNGIEAIRQIKDFSPDIKAIVLTMHNDVAYAMRAFDVGANGYIVKHAAADELITAIREVIKGRTYITPHIAGELFLAVRNSVDQDQQDTPIARLTPRQREVLQLVAEGHTAQQIADALCISRRTVEFHKYKIMDALGVKSSSDLVAVAIKHGVVTI
jgi:DNA-binding NarL/FixJ family response regulator